MRLLNFPNLIQTYEYDCGATALQTVLAYYGIEVYESTLMKSAKTNKKDGTTIKGVLRTLKRYKLKFDAKKMSIQNLKDYIDKRIPVIILLQAWGRKGTEYANDYRDGHWAVVIGYSGRKIFFEDPWAFTRTFLTNSELKKRWHETEGGKKIANYGIAVYGKRPRYKSNRIAHMD